MIPQADGLAQDATEPPKAVEETMDLVQEVLSIPVEADPFQDAALPNFDLFSNDFQLSEGGLDPLNLEGHFDEDFLQHWDTGVVDQVTPTTSTDDILDEIANGPMLGITDDLEDSLYSTLYQGFESASTSTVHLTLTNQASVISSADRAEDDEEEGDDDEDDEDEDDDEEEENQQAPEPQKRKSEGKGKQKQAPKRARMASGSTRVASRARSDNPTDDAKRRVHNMSERNRRGTMKLNYKSLREAIPELSGTDRPSNRTILTKAVDYIVEQSRLLAENREALARLRITNELLRQNATKEILENMVPVLRRD